MRNAAADNVGPPQQAHRECHIASGNRSTNLARMDDQASYVNRPDHLDPEPMTGTVRYECLDAPRPAAAEVEVMTNDQFLRVEHLDQESTYELLSLDLREISSESLHDRRIHSTGCKSCEPVAKRHEQARRGVRPQHGHRMRLERQCDGGATVKIRVLAYTPQNDLVSAVNPVEVSDCDYRTPELATRALQTPDDPHDRKAESRSGTHLLEQPVRLRSLVRTRVPIDQFL
jgi:hypothetical protein